MRKQYKNFLMLFFILISFPAFSASLKPEEVAENYYRYLNDDKLDKAMALLSEQAIAATVKMYGESDELTNDEKVKAILSMFSSLLKDEGGVESINVEQVDYTDKNNATVYLNIITAENGHQNSLKLQKNSNKWLILQ